MTETNKDKQPQSPQPPRDQNASDKQKQKAAELEIAGRHKNDGQNDHTGHAPRS